MKALLMRLSGIDSDAEAALRIIEYFDALTARGASIDMVVRGASALGEAVAGARLPGGTVLRYDINGEQQDSRQPAGNFRVHVRGDVSAWLERSGPPQKFDDLMLERFSLAAQSAAVDNPRNEPLILADGGLVETVLSLREPAEERTIALRRLGVPAHGHVVVLAVAEPSARSTNSTAVHEFVAGLQRRHLVRAATIGSLLAVIVHQPTSSDARAAAVELVDDLNGRRTRALAGVRVGMSEPVDAFEAGRGWASATVALRFAAPHQDRGCTVDAGSLGALAPLTEIDSASWMTSNHVAVLREMAETESGRVDISVLEAYLAHGSLRQAGVVLHMHHSSIASRLARLEEKLELDLSAPADAFKARMSLLGMVLAQTAPESRS